jgi:hypothetical protein
MGAAKIISGGRGGAENLFHKLKLSSLRIFLLIALELWVSVRCNRSILLKIILIFGIVSSFFYNFDFLKIQGMADAWIPPHHGAYVGMPSLECAIMSSVSAMQHYCGSQKVT